MCIRDSGRAEEIIKDRREKYDIGLCRGVSNLPVILEYEIPFLKVNGRFLPQKMVGTDEVKNSSNALKVLNSKILKEYKFKLPFSNECLCLCACPPKFRLLCLFLVAHRPVSYTHLLPKRRGRLRK